MREQCLILGTVGDVNPFVHGGGFVYIGFEDQLRPETIQKLQHRYDVNWKEGYLKGEPLDVTAWLAKHIPAHLQPMTVTVEWWDTASDPPDKDDWDAESVEVCRLDRPEDSLKEWDWLDWSGVAAYLGQELEDLTEGLNGTNPVEWASIVVSASTYSRLDHYPSKFTIRELRQRWEK
jgi:hypothetical protein